jgi:hypothetical protein
VLRLPAEDGGIEHVTELGWSVYDQDKPPPITMDREFITPEIAQRLLESCHYDRQRDITKSHVKALALAHARRQYSLQGIVLCEVEGKWLLTNGRHRMQMIVDSGIGVWEVIIRKHGMTRAMVEAEYGRTDRGKRRQIADALRAHGIGGEYGLTPRELNLISGAVGVILPEFGYTKPEIRIRLGLNDPDARVAAVEKWLEFGNAYFKAIKDPLKGRYQDLVLSATMAVALVNFRETPEKAEDFWGRVAHDTPLPGDPVRTLLEAYGKHPDERHKAPVFARRIASCWNAFYEGQQITRTVTPNTAEPITIAGSAIYKGRATRSFAGY